MLFRHVSWYFKIIKNPIFSNQRYLRVGPTLAGRSRPGRAGPTAPDPVRDSNHGQRPDTVCDIQTSRAVGQARSARGSNLADMTSALPGPWDFQIIFAFSSRCVSASSRFRGHSMLVTPHPAVSLGSHSLSTTCVRSRAWHAPIPAIGYRWCRVGYVVPWSGVFWATTNVVNRDFVFSLGNCKKIGVMNREVFVVNHDKKNHDSRQKPHESWFFSFVRNGPNFNHVMWLIIVDCWL